MITRIAELLNIGIILLKLAFVDIEQQNTSD